MPFLIRGKTNWKFILIVLILAILVGGGILGWIKKLLQPQANDVLYKQAAIKNNNPLLCEKIRNLETKDDCYLTLAKQTENIFLCEKIKKESLKISCHSDLLEKTPSENKVFVTHTQENEKNILVFEIDFKDYFVKSIDLSNLGPNFSQYGSQSIVPLKFDFSHKLPFLKIKADIAGERCRPEIPYLSIEVDLPLNSEVIAKLIDFQETKIEERLEIIPTIVCHRSIDEGGECEDCPNYLKEDEFFPPDFLISQDKNRFEEKETLRINFPLFKHNPKTRETYRIEKAKIKIEYTFPEYSSLIIEEKDVPSEVSSLEKFNLTYQIINPSLSKIEDLVLKATLKDSHGSIVEGVSSEKFEIDAGELKIVSLLMEGLEEGNYLLEISLFKNSLLKAVGRSKYIRFVLPFEFEVLKPPEILTINDNLSAIVKNKSKWSAKIDVYFEVLDPHYINLGKLFAQPKILEPNQEAKFDAPVAGPIVNYCQKGECTAIAYAKIDTDFFEEKYLGPIYLSNIRGFLPNYCEDDLNCVCCDSTEIGYPYEKNVCVNKIYAQKYNCRSAEFSLNYIGICDKKYSECRAERMVEPTECKSEEISIFTEKENYKLGEVIKITVKNNSDKTIWGFQTCSSVIPWWSLQKFEGGEWREINFSFPLTEAGLGVISRYCEFIVCENFENQELKPGSEIVYGWDTSKEICEWLGKSEEKPQPQLIFPGKYRIYVLYGCNRYFNSSKANIVYSNEFEIQK